MQQGGKQLLAEFAFSSQGCKHRACKNCKQKSCADSQQGEEYSFPEFSMKNQLKKGTEGFNWRGQDDSAVHKPSGCLPGKQPEYGYKYFF